MNATKDGWVKQSPRKSFNKQKGPIEIRLADQSEEILTNPRSKEEIINPEDVLAWRPLKGAQWN